MMVIMVLHGRIHFDMKLPLKKASRMSFVALAVKMLRTNSARPKARQRVDIFEPVQVPREVRSSF